MVTVRHRWRTARAALWFTATPKSEPITAVELHPSTLVAARCDPHARLDRNVRERRPKVPLEDVLRAPLNCSSVYKVCCAARDHEEYHLWPAGDSLLNTYTALARGEAVTCVPHWKREYEDGRHPADCVAGAGRQASDVLIRVHDGASRQELCRSSPKFSGSLIVLHRMSTSAHTTAAAKGAAPLRCVCVCGGGEYRSRPCAVPRWDLSRFHRHQHRGQVPERVLHEQ